MRRRSVISIRPIAEAMTTAASAVFGRCCSSVGREQQQQRDRQRADHAGQLGAGACRLGHRGARRTAADREALEETGGEVGDAKTHHLLVRVDRRAQARRIGPRKHARVGERDQRDGEAAGDDRTRGSSRGDQRQPRRGQALRQRAEHARRPRALRGRTPRRRRWPPTTAIRMPGTRGHRLSNRISASVLPPMASAATFVCPPITPSTMAHACRSGPSALTENPNSLGIWLRITVSAMPFM